MPVRKLKTVAKPMGEDGPKLSIDGISTKAGRTYRELAEDLDEADLDGNEFAVDFVSDAVDHPERFRTQKQLDKLEELWERYCDG